MRTVRRLRLRDLLFGTICVLLPSLLAHHVETSRAQQSILKSDRCRLITSMYPICFGGPGENRTPVHSAFDLKELQQYTNYTTIIFMSQPIDVWWAGLDSNQRPSDHGSPAKTD